MVVNYNNKISIFLLVIGLVMFFHSLVPHDHHYDNHIETTHEEHQEKDASGNEPLHCHFLNDIIVNQASTSNQTVVKQISLCVLYITTVKSNTIRDLFCESFTAQIIHFPDRLFLSKNSPTRGSPLS